MNSQRVQVLLEGVLPWLEPGGLRYQLRLGYGCPLLSDRLIEGEHLSLAVY